MDNKIDIAIRSGNNIDEQEWNDLTKYILENKMEFPDYIQGDNGINTKALTNHILDFAHNHRRSGETDPDIFNPKAVPDISLKPHIKVFIENSGSMDGYIRGTTDFEAALSDLLVQIQYYYDNSNLQVNFINTKIYPSQITSVQDFVQALDPDKKTSPYRVGNRKVSKLNEILKMILDSTSKENISILISDCIYSIEKEKNTSDALEFEKSLTKGAFLEKSKEFGFSTIIYKMQSKFTGKYWDKDNKFKILDGDERPYYVWIIGSNENINDFSKKINTRTLKGLEHSYSLSNFTNQRQPYYSVLKETNKIGSFKATDRDAQDVKSIKDVEYVNNILQFSIALDLNNIPVDSSYLTDPKNYVVPEGFSVKEICKISRNKLSAYDMLNVGQTSATHYITISTSNKFKLQDLDIELSNGIPRWVDASSSLDDTEVKNELDKTFGLSYLIRGVSEAYLTKYPGQNSYFKILIKINP